MTNQRDEKSPKLASCGWLLYPKTGRVGVFHGDYLHGVVPGRPSTSSRTTTRSPLDIASRS